MMTRGTMIDMVRVLERLARNSGLDEKHSLQLIVST